MNGTAIIVGKGGHAHVVASLLPHPRIRFMVLEDPSGDDILQDDFFAGPPVSDADYYIGIGDNDARRSYADRLRERGIRLANCVAPTAWIAADARLGEGVFVGTGAVVGTRARIGDNVIVNTLSSVDHDCEIGADSQIGPGVTLGGRVMVGTGCFIGMKSCVVPGLTLGDRVFVRAGAVVVGPAPDGVKLSGAPARIVR